MIQTTRSKGRRRAPSQSYPLTSEIVSPGVADRVWHPFNSILPPQRVAQILQGVIQGDPLEQENLFNNMMGTWPDLGQAVNQVCDEVAKAPLIVQAFAVEGEEPSTLAQDKAAVIRQLKQFMRPTPNSRREGWQGTLKGLAMGYHYGLTVRETFWETTQDGTFPVSTEEYAATYYRYPTDGSQVEQLLFSPNGRSAGIKLEQFDPNKHLIGENRWHRGGILQTAPLRSLVPYWIAKTYGLKWFLDYGQVFGVPFRLGTYPEGDNQAKIALNDALASLGSSAWGSAPAGTKIEITPNSQSAATLPQKELISLANNAVAKFILGQTLTSDTGENGNRSLGDVHEKVRRGRIESVVAFVAQILNNQFVPAVIRANWPDCSELPFFTADWPDDEDGLAKVERDEKLFGTMGLPVALKDIYERHGVRRPEDGEELYAPQKALSAAAEPEESGQDGVNGVPSRALPKGPEPGRTPTSEQEEAATAQAQRDSKQGLVQAAATLNTKTLEALQDNVAAMVPNVSREWLAPASDLFNGLVQRALDGETTEQEFGRVLAEAAALIPDLELNEQALESALVNAVGTAMLAGAGQKALDLPAKLSS